MILWMLVFVVVVIAAGIGVGMLCTNLRDRHSRLLLGTSDATSGKLSVVRARLDARSVADTEPTERR